MRKSPTKHKTIPKNIEFREHLKSPVVAQNYRLRFEDLRLGGFNSTAFNTKKGNSNMLKIFYEAHHPA